MIIPDKELEDEIKKFIEEVRYSDYEVEYISSETFYIEFINYLVSRGLEITIKK
jgi:hypothetical protein